MKNLLRYFFNLNRSMVVAATFAALILTGTFLLMLPISNTQGEWMPFIDALFTATSATCVTGLAVVDTGKYFTLFGETVLILLIQIGGLGIMTLTTLFSVGLGKRINIRHRLLIQESLNQEGPSGVIKMAVAIVKYTLIIEFIFGSILAAYFYDAMGSKALYWGYWHSISAFCNAGFDLFGDFKSLVDHQQSIIVNLCFIMLIILGGIGFTVIGEVAKERRWNRFSLHTKMVLIINTALIIGGTVMIWLLEFNNDSTLGKLGAGDQFMAALFQSVSARTAGFNTIDISMLTNATLFFMMFLMFVGASSTSTGGGIKTTTFGVLVLSTLSLLRNKKETVLFNRRIDNSLIAKSNSIFILSVLWLGLAFFLLLMFDTHGHPFQKVLFELFSAFGTVGLGVGITTEWNDLCKMVLIATMYIGRIGILTFGMSFFSKETEKVRYPTENIIVG